MSQTTFQFRQRVVGALCAVLMSGVPSLGDAAPKTQDEAATLYQQGYDLVLQEQWQAGGDLLREVSRRFPESDWADDSHFWICHAEARVQSDA